MRDPRPNIPIDLQERRERRAATRVPAVMPMTVNGQAASTRDLSASGLRFLAQQAFAPGERVEVVVEYLLDGHRYPLACQAEVVRSLPADGGYEVAARLVPQFGLAELEVPAQGPRLRPL